MKFKNITLFAALTLLTGLLTGCNRPSKVPGPENPNPDVQDPDNPNGGDTPDVPDTPVTPLPEGKSRFKFVLNEDVLSFESTLKENEIYDEYEEGVVTFKLKPFYFIEKIIQNDYVTVRRDKDDKFKFFFDLLPGENTFVLTTYKKENIYNENGLLEGPDNIVNNDGVMSDDIDERPAPGGIPPKPLPHYENEGSIYFIDRAWWNEGAASTSIICYNARGKIVNTNNSEIGDMMQLYKENKLGRENVWKWNIDLDRTAYVQFVRTGNYGMNDWNSKTEKIAVDYPTINTYHLTKEEIWSYDPQGHFKGFAKVEETTFDKYVPSQPVDYGTYSIYVHLSKTWAETLKKENLGVNVYTWGLGGELKGWPGAPIDKVSDTVYKCELNTILYQNLIFLLAKDGTCYNSMQTIDLVLPVEKYGKNAELKAEIAESTGKPSVTWSRYTAQ